MPADGALKLSLHPVLDIERPTLAGPAGSADRLTLDLLRLAVARGADGTIPCREPPLKARLWLQPAEPGR